MLIRPQGLRQRELAFGVGSAAQLLVRLTQNVVGGGILRVHLQSALQKSDGERGVAFVQLHFTEQNVRSGKVGVQSGRLLERGLGIVPFFHARVSIAHPPVG